MEGVYVKWVDSSSVRESTWMDLEDAKKLNVPDVAESVGFIAAEDADSIMLTLSVIESTETRSNASVDYLLVIPKSAILTRLNLGVSSGGNSRTRKAAPK